MNRHFLWPDSWRSLSKIPADTLTKTRSCVVHDAGDAGPKPEEPEAAAVSAAALAFFRNRASAPRDMSAAATVQFRAACDAVLAQVY
jgi:hypothetical protein